MNRESEFEKTIKWIILGAAAVCGLCHLIMLFSEFHSYSGVGTLANGLFHIAACGAAGVIFFLFFTSYHDKDVYSGYLIGGIFALGAIVDICLMVRLISLTKGTARFSVVLIVFIVILALLELLIAFFFVRYSLDRMTGVLPMLTAFLGCILRGIVYSSSDSKIRIPVGKTTESVSGVYSIWFFIGLVFFFILIICVVLYFDNAFLSELVHEPKKIFTKNALFGTYTNMYVKPEQKVKQKVELKVEQKVEQKVDQGVVYEPVKEAVIPISLMGAVDEKVCPECGCPVSAGTKMCPECGYLLDSDVKAEEEKNETMNITPIGNLGRICPDCGCPLEAGQTACPDCGCPIE